MNVAPALLIGLLLATLQADDARKKAVFERGVLKPSGPVLFEPGTDKLKPDSDAVLGEIKEALAERSYVTLLRIEAHSDTDGDPAASQTLTEKRARAVARKLVSLGVDCKRLVPVGFGGNKPVAENSTPDGKVQNRRITFVPAALRGVLIGGMPADGGGKGAGDPCEK
jgi:OOP family OmpA-OmpF porin